MSAERPKQRVTSVAKMAGTASVENQLAAEAELMASFGESK